jgi:putative MATE family efflux protein
MDGVVSKGVDVLLGNPKKAIVAFSIPIAVALLAQQSNNLVDSFWVINLGGDALAALGLVSPIFSIIIGVANGIAIGASAAIARKIGMGRADEAGGIAVQSLILGAIVALILTPLLLLTARPVLMAIGAGSTIDLSMEFAVPLYICTILIFLSAIMSGILRGEGAANKSMYIQVVGAVTNLVMDPILIYGLDMGVAGAAWATAFAFGISIVIGLYWYLSKKNMFLQLRRRDLRINIPYQKEILSVGIPQSTEFVMMGLFNVGFNFCVILVGGTDMMGVYTVAWRITYMLFVPAQALGGAIVSACSAEFGMKRYDMISTAYRYAVKLSLIILTALTVIMVILADPIASAFTTDPNIQYLHSDMVVMLYVFASFIPIMSLIFLGSSLLQALKRGGVSLMSSFIRNLMLAVMFLAATYWIGTPMSLWLAIAVTEICGGLLMGYWAYVVLKDTARKDGRSLASDT